ncbi:MAG TPA: ATP-dependent DNA ligase [Gaiellaceae bacterium]|nr:ATP-dependent DNA ligase [Gaiellaceae bacterium]
MLLGEIADTSADVATTSSRLAKVARLAECLARARPEEVRVAVSYLSGVLPQGTIGIGWAALRELPQPAALPPALELLEADAAVSRIAAIAGPGSQAARRSELAGLFSRATEPEQRFLVGLLLGELRQGALEGVMVDAVAKAAGIPAPEVRRALMLSGDLGEVAAAAIGEGREALARFRLTVLRPVQPMLAQTADDLEAALERIRPALLEWKLDGARIQVHRLGDEVRAFTRNLADITDRVPEIVKATRALPVASAILDGEAIALSPDGRPRPFQVTMSRFSSRVNLAQLVDEVPLSGFFFDALHLDGEDLVDLPAAERAAALGERLPPALAVPRIETADVSEARRFLEEALARGHEGVMVKAPGAPYEAGRRGAGWLKVKIAHTLDLVVLAAEWGHGRRRGKLSNLHLGARDPETAGFVMLGKTFKGMTDEMLAWQTERLLELETHREGQVVHVRPELVVEIAFDGVQTSPRYPGGMALRFARVKGYRADKRPDDADTIDTIRAIHTG